MNNALKGITLIELLIAIAIAAVITSSVYFSLNTALESWGQARNQLGLQKVLSELIDEIGGSAVSYGIRDSLEVIEAGAGRIKFVPPWTDDAHSSSSRDFIYTLNRRIKPGTALPIGEMRFPESNKFQLVPVRLIELEDTSLSQVRLGAAVPLGCDLRFIYHPDPEGADTVKSIWWEKSEEKVYIEGKKGKREISQNPFGVKIINLEFRYYDNTNKLITDRSWVDRRDINRITGAEIYIEGELGGLKQTALGFFNLRNAPMRSGYLSLSEGARIPIPNSQNIHSLLLTNISGVSSGDELELEASPSSGKTWRINIKFSRTGPVKPTIDSYSIEYPPQRAIYTEYPRTHVRAGLNLLTLGTSGLYDYDDDIDIEDFVLLEGEVMLKVRKMDIEGAGVFIRP